MLDQEKFAQIVEQAKAAGSEAAKRRYDEIAGDPRWDECGGARMYLIVKDEDTQNFLNTITPNLILGFTISRVKKGKYSISIQRMAVYQEMDVCLTAAKAALSVFEKEIGVKGETGSYFS